MEPVIPGAGVSAETLPCLFRALLFCPFPPVKVPTVDLPKALRVIPAVPGGAGLLSREL